MFNTLFSLRKISVNLSQTKYVVSLPEGTKARQMQITDFFPTLKTFGIYDKIPNIRTIKIKGKPGKV